MEEPPTQTLSIPSLVAFAIVSFFAIRYLFFSSSTSSTSSSSSNASAYPGSSRSTPARRRNFPPDRVETVSNMFPQLSRRDIEWDLVNNGGSVQATTEKVLMSGRLPGAPPNFTPLYASPPPSANTSSSRPQQKQTYQDLITRYNLSSKVSTNESSTEGGENELLQSKEKQKEKGGWSSSKVERQELMKRRREEMILAARRKMEEKERKDAKGKAPLL